MTTITLPQQAYPVGTVVHEYDNVEPFGGFSLVLQRISWPPGLCLTAELDFGGGRVESAQFAGGQLKGNTSFIRTSTNTQALEGEITERAIAEVEAGNPWNITYSVVKSGATVTLTFDLRCGGFKVGNQSKAGPRIGAVLSKSAGPFLEAVGQAFGLAMRAHIHFRYLSRLYRRSASMQGSHLQFWLT